MVEFGFTNEVYKSIIILFASSGKTNNEVAVWCLFRAGLTLLLDTCQAELAVS